VTDIPDTLVLERHRDLEGMGRRGIWVRRAVIGLIVLISLLGLANVFGQRPATVRADVPKAIVSLYATSATRGGDFMEARLHITAKRDLHNARLLLDPGWAEGLSMNTIEPSPISETSVNGRLAFELGRIPAGHSYILFLQLQVNPTNVAWHRPQNVELLDGTTRLAVLHHSLTVYP
jgi:hypothetical protein